MEDSKFCKQCHKPVPETAPEGLCPECLAKVAMGSEPKAGEERTPPKLADVALWRLDSLPQAGIADPVAALVLGSAPPLELLVVNGRVIVEHDHVLTVDEQQAALAARGATRRLLRKAGVTS